VNTDRSPLRPLFLAQLEEWHAKYGYTRELPILADALGVKIQHSAQHSCMLDWDPPIIMIQVLENDRFIPPRFLFKFFHELSHLLFLRLDGGAFQRALYRRYSTNPTGYELVLEGMCNAGAARLLMPDLLVKSALQVHGHSPAAVVSLSRISGASWAAAMLRLLNDKILETWGVIIRAERTHSDSAWDSRWEFSTFVGPDSRPHPVKGELFPHIHPLLEHEDHVEISLDVDGGFYTDLRPCLMAHIGNERFRRVCAFLFPDEESRALALAGG